MMMHRVIRRGGVACRQLRPLSTADKSPFDDQVHLIHRTNAAKMYRQSNGEYEYLRDVVAEHLVDRLRDISRDFDTLVDFGCGTGNILPKLVELSDCDIDDKNFEGPNGIKRVIHLDASGAMIDAAKERAADIGKLSCDFHTAPLSQALQTVPKGSADVVLSNLVLHWENDITRTLTVARSLLKPDGVFIGALFGGETLFELRTAMAVAEQEREGGISAHVSPMLRTADACGVLNDAGFKLTTVDTNSIIVEYESAYSCMHHLWNMGESNALRQRRHMVSRETMMATAAAYHHLFADDSGFVPATFQITYLIGWAPSPTQPQPLKPGTHSGGFGFVKNKQS